MENINFNSENCDLNMENCDLNIENCDLNMENNNTIIDLKEFVLDNDFVNDTSSLFIYHQIDKSDLDTCLYIYYEALKNEKLYICEYVWNKINECNSSFETFLALFDTKYVSVKSKWIVYLLDKHYLNLEIKEKIKLFKKCISTEKIKQVKFIAIFQKIIDDDILYEMLDLPLHSCITCLESICLEYYNLICHEITWTQLWNMPSFNVDHVIYFARQNINTKNKNQNEFQLWFERFKTQKKFELYRFESLLVEEILENNRFENQKEDFYFYILQNLDFFTECDILSRLCCQHYKFDVTKKYLLEQSFLNFSCNHIIHMCYIMFRELKDNIFLFEITLNQKSALDYLLEYMVSSNEHDDTLFYEIHYLIDNFRDPNHIYNFSKKNTLEFLITNSLNEHCDLFDITIYFICNYEWNVSYFACNDDIPMFFPKVIAEVVFKNYPELLHSEKYAHYINTYSYFCNASVCYEKVLKMCKTLYIPPELANYMTIPNDIYMKIALQYNL